MSFPEKKFKEDFKQKEELMGERLKGVSHRLISASYWARWGYLECDKEVTPVLEGLVKATRSNFEQGRKEGYEQAETERKARDAKLREILSGILIAKNVCDHNPKLLRRDLEAALLLVEEEAKTT